MTSITRVRNLPASGAFVPVAALSALVGLLLCSSSMFPTPAFADVPGYLGITWRTVPATPCPDTLVSIRFDACRCNVEFLGAELPPAPGGGPVVVRARIRPYIVCGWCDPDSITVPLGTFAAGNYVITIRVEADVEDSLGQFQHEIKDFPFPFIVSPTCQPYPGKILPYLDEVVVGRQQNACPNQDIPVVLIGQFPDGCTHLSEVRHVPSPIAGPRPEPDVIEIIYGFNSCTDPACPAVIVPWKSELGLPGLPPGRYGLIVRTLLRDECHRSLPIPIGQAILPFNVRESCDSLPFPGPCFDARFVQRPHAECDDVFSRGHPAHATLEVASTSPLAGLQGHLRFNLPGLFIQDLATIGAAAGMRLFWTREPEGAQFVLFSDHGTLIPRRLPDWEQPWEPILNVTAVMDTDFSTATRSIRLSARDLIASDSVGTGVPGCIDITLDRSIVRDRDATLCFDQPCDLNGDGQSDVRDLVRMVSCVVFGAACPGDLDCDGNAQVNLDDVFCCARRVLHIDAPIGGERDNAAVTVTMGTPARVAGGYDVTVNVNGLEHLGGARLDVAYPSDRYDLEGVDLPSPHPGWLNLTEPGDGQIGIAMIYAGSYGLPATSYGQSAVLHLRLKPGMTDGGDVAVTGGQFVAGDGAVLRVQAAGISSPLGAAGRLALSSPLPNPTRAGASFSISLAEPGDLDVGVFDAGGRRIATLFHGRAEAGTRGYTWDGRRSSGQAAGSGLYFVRAESLTDKVSKKVMILSPR